MDMVGHQNVMIQKESIFLLVTGQQFAISDEVGIFVEDVLPVISSRKDMTDIPSGRYAGYSWHEDRLLDLLESINK
jgi:hypothetical protein